MKKIILFTIVLLYGTAVIAQTVDDAYLYSQVFYQGTAKSLGMGNAMGAVGGDMTSVCINPAGMGIYRSDELTSSLNLLDSYSISEYYGSSKDANKMRLSIPNIGFVHAKQRSNYKALRYTQFGFGLTRTNDYNQHTCARGFNPTSSKIDTYLGQINGLSTYDLTDLYPYDIGPAWNTYLIDTCRDESGRYYFFSPVPQGNIWQEQEDNIKGRSEEWNFSGSLNYFDKLFIGLSMDLTHIKRTGTRKFMESVEGDEMDFNEWSFEETLSSTGWGCNGKIGLIYHATPWFRLGAAFHTPTQYSFDESWQTQTISEISHVTFNAFSPESHYEYYFISPLKWIGSMAFVIGQQGMVSVDAECTNYGAARFKALANDDYDYGPKNESIKSTFGRSFNFRLGSEWLVGNTYLRMGVGYYGSPLGLGNSNGSIKKASAGVSLPIGSASAIDFAYELSYGQTYFRLYDAGVLGIEPVTQKQFKNNLLVTLKLRF